MYIIIHEQKSQTILIDQEEVDLEKFRVDNFSFEILSEENANFDLSKPNAVKVISGNTVDQLFRKFISNKIIIEAAGGMILDPQNRLLMIFRRGNWDLPKGKLDEGESIKECAIREVTEETGLHSILITNTLQITYHTYMLGSQLILKPSHWFEMKFTGSETPIPQTEEDITEIRWVDKDEAFRLLDMMFPSIREIVMKYFLS